MGPTSWCMSRAFSCADFSDMRGIVRRKTLLLQNNWLENDTYGPFLFSSDFTVGVYSFQKFVIRILRFSLWTVSFKKKIKNTASWTFSCFAKFFFIKTSLFVCNACLLQPCFSFLFVRIKIASYKNKIWLSYSLIMQFFKRSLELTELTWAGRDRLTCLTTWLIETRY